MAPLAHLVTRFEVDEIVLCYVPNDIEKRLPRSDAFDPIRPPESRFIDPDRSCLLDHLFRRIWVPRAASVRDYHDWLADGLDDPDIWRAGLTGFDLFYNGAVKESDLTKKTDQILFNCGIKGSWRNHLDGNPSSPSERRPHYLATLPGSRRTPVDFLGLVKKRA